MMRFIHGHIWMLFIYIKLVKGEQNDPHVIWYDDMDTYDKNGEWILFGSINYSINFIHQSNKCPSSNDCWEINSISNTKDSSSYIETTISTKNYFNISLQFGISINSVGDDDDSRCQIICNDNLTIHEYVYDSIDYNNNKLPLQQFRLPSSANNDMNGLNIKFVNNANNNYTSCYFDEISLTASYYKHDAQDGFISDTTYVVIVSVIVICFICGCAFCLYLHGKKTVIKYSNHKNKNSKKRSIRNLRLKSSSSAMSLPSHIKSIATLSKLRNKSELTPISPASINTPYATAEAYSPDSPQMTDINQDDEKIKFKNAAARITRSRPHSNSNKSQKSDSNRSGSIQNEDRDSGKVSEKLSQKQSSQIVVHNLNNRNRSSQYDSPSVTQMKLSSIMDQVLNDESKPNHSDTSYVSKQSTLISSPPSITANTANTGRYMVPTSAMFGVPKDLNFNRTITPTFKSMDTHTALHSIHSAVPSVPSGQSLHLTLYDLDEDTRSRPSGTGSVRNSGNQNRIVDLTSTVTPTPFTMNTMNDVDDNNGRHSNLSNSNYSAVTVPTIPIPNLPNDEISIATYTNMSKLHHGKEQNEFNSLSVGTTYDTNGEIVSKLKTRYSKPTNEMKAMQSTQSTQSLDPANNMFNIVNNKLLNQKQISLSTITNDNNKVNPIISPQSITADASPPKKKIHRSPSTTITEYDLNEDPHKIILNKSIKYTSNPNEEEESLDIGGGADSVTRFNNEYNQYQNYAYNQYQNMAMIPPKSASFLHKSSIISQVPTFVSDKSGKSYTDMDDKFDNDESHRL